MLLSVSKTNGNVKKKWISPPLTHTHASHTHLLIATNQAPNRTLKSLREFITNICSCKSMYTRVRYGQVGKRENTMACVFVYAFSGNEKENGVYQHKVNLESYVYIAARAINLYTPGDSPN